MINRNVYNNRSNLETTWKLLMLIKKVDLMKSSKQIHLLIKFPILGGPNGWIIINQMFILGATIWKGVVVGPCFVNKEVCHILVHQNGVLWVVDIWAKSFVIVAVEFEAHHFRMPLHSIERIFSPWWNMIYLLIF